MPVPGQNVSSGIRATGISSWSKWYQPGSANDAEIFADALQKCKEVNEQLSSQPWWEEQTGLVAAAVVDGSPIRLKQPRLYNDSWLQDLVERERERVKKKQASKPEWLKTLIGVAEGVISVANQIKPIIDIFVPQSPEYTVPYACLWILFKGITDRRTKKDSVLSLITSLSSDIPVLQAYQDMFPTDEMKRTLAQFYIHTVDLLWRLAKYHSHHFFRQLTDALLPRAQYDFPIYLQNINTTATKLKKLCDAGHAAEQKDIKALVETLSSDLRFLSQHLEITRIAQARHYASNLINAWHDEVGDVEHDFLLWQAIQFYTDMRDHWSQNGILPCVAEWRALCDKSQNSILWISSESNGRQSWLTEFSVDLIAVCRSQGQLVAIGMCDRPNGAKWTPKQLLKQMISQLLNDTPRLTISSPNVFNIRNFQRATTFNSTFRLLHSILGAVGSVVIVIDRLDLCVPDPDEKHISAPHALSVLVGAHPSIRVIVTAGQVTSPLTLPELPISFATVNTRRRPRRQESPPPPKPDPMGSSYDSYTDSSGYPSTHLHF